MLLLTVFMKPVSRIVTENQQYRTKAFIYFLL